MFNYKNARYSERIIKKEIRLIALQNSVMQSNAVFKLPYYLLSRPLNHQCFSNCMRDKNYEYNFMNRFYSESIFYSYLYSTFTNI